ncbi:hypothetical protein Smp_097740 [Schistosoma mansoni]|uniref:hypothetical protein n=1 Tax=Schistosoma mansoni TaxID=6183 RepID=UPI00022C8146|nr:hypothetical protein Smp_097740 [Schistosoma mansoni]|eukprot:XP_018645912.1 hypothetical protein Smp_097740 [Schistosoma mansoni]
MIPLIDFSKKNVDILSLHSMIETVEQNRVGFLEEVFHEYKSSPNFDIYDSKTTSFSLSELSSFMLNTSDSLKEYNRPNLNEIVEGAIGDYSIVFKFDAYKKMWTVEKSL